MNFNTLTLVGKSITSLHLNGELFNVTLVEVSRDNETHCLAERLAFSTRQHF